MITKKLKVCKLGFYWQKEDEVVNKSAVSKVVDLNPGNQLRLLGFFDFRWFQLSRRMFFTPLTSLSFFISSVRTAVSEMMMVNVP